MVVHETSVPESLSRLTPISLITGGVVSLAPDAYRTVCVPVTVSASVVIHCAVEPLATWNTTFLNEFPLLVISMERSSIPKPTIVVVGHHAPGARDDRQLGA